MFEDRTLENLLDEAMAQALPGVDTRPGSIFYDAEVGNCTLLARHYASMDEYFALVMITTSVDEYLDMWGEEFAKLPRNEAQKAIYEYHFTGMQPEVGEVFFADTQYFTLIESEEGVLHLEAVEPGIAANSIPQGTTAVPMRNHGSNLPTSTFGELIKPGVDIEDDEPYRDRIREKLGGPSENGNRAHYKTWCETDPGVGRAHIIPLFAGENTVMAVIVDNEGKPALQAVVDAVQEYVDPITKGIQREYNGEMVTVGDGTGNGVANIGAHFLAIPAESQGIAVSFRAEVANGATIDSARQQATEAIAAYLKELALNTKEDERPVVRMSTIGALLYAQPSILDYVELQINGAAANVELTSMQVPELEGVTVDAIIR